MPPTMLCRHTIDPTDPFRCYCEQCERTRSEHRLRRIQEGLNAQADRRVRAAVAEREALDSVPVQEVWHPNWKIVGPLAAACGGAMGLAFEVGKHALYHLFK